ncbi:ParD-like family protein [Massilia pinisoli]|uniref:ParD-like family protein n=1 Tax=Massilia pinisoli TaxID=1772194 RepID=A0ABT1ZLI1_9BURK|nr:ParD-like family protein [Massilia pinisoli]MCS0580782.1 ParD-like family protein [Massilia pinisoli]
MGIVNIEDELHDQIRKASTVSCRSINAQAAFWVRIGMLCELHPTQSFNEIMARELRAAGVVPQALKVMA